MTQKNKPKRTGEESKLAVVAIQDGNSTKLITSDGVYVLGKQGNLLTARSHEKDYRSSVREALQEIGERLSSGQFGGEYKIQYDGKMNFPVDLA